MTLLAGGSCKSKDADKEPEPTEESVEPPEVDVDALLELDERAFPLLIWSAFSVERDYFDRSRLDPRAQLLSALTNLGLHRPEFFAEPKGEDTVLVTVVAQSREFSVAVDGPKGGLVAAAERLEEILEFTREVLELTGNDERELEYAAINGLLAPLDPHTILLDPKEHDDLGVKTRGQFGGIGAEILADARRIRIMRVLPGSPAETAGVRDGDLVLAIDDQSTVNMSASDAQQLLRGPVDTVVKVKLQRGDEVLTATITRKTIKVESVTAEVLPARIGYIKITTFQRNTGEQVAKALARMMPEGAGDDALDKAPEGGPLRGLVIDVRDNSGGLLTQAIEVVDQLVDAGELVIVRSVQGREAEVAKPEMSLPASASVVVLIDEGSASASEIVSGALQQLDRGVVVGRGSFGKGTVQLLTPKVLYDQEQGLKLTIAEYFVAGDRPVQTAGVEPDLSLIPVQLTPLAGIAYYYDLERFERRRERAQVAHLPSARHERPFDPRSATADDRLLRYYLDPQSPAGRKAGGAEEDRLALLDDPEIRIAHAVADALVGVAPSARKEALRNLRTRLAKEEDEAIAAGLGRTGVRWAGAPGVHGQPKLAVTATVEGPTPIRAGAPFVLAIELQNQGDAPAERVHLITECLQDELDGIELMIGEVAPGEVVRRKLRLQVMSWHTDFTDTLTLEAHGGEPDETPDAATSVRIVIDGSPRPHLVYDYWIVDDPALAREAPARPKTPPVPGEPPFTVHGNGDGALQPGEAVLLAVRVRNDGPGDAGDVRTLLRNRSGAQALLEEGFFELGAIKAGGAATGAFGISVSDKAIVDKPVELELAVADVGLRESAQHTFELRVVGPREPLRLGQARVQVKEPARIYNAADARASVIGQLAAGDVIDVVGETGGWRALALPGGRRGFVPESLVAEAKGKAKAPTLDAAIVTPPRVELDPVETVVAGATITVHGVARHPRKAHDVVVSVKPAGPAQVEKKLFYRANDAREGEALRALEFSAEVPLTPGSNEIYVTARDGDEVEATRVLRVFRDDQAR